MSEPLHALLIANGAELVRLKDGCLKHGDHLRFVDEHHAPLPPKTTQWKQDYDRLMQAIHAVAADFGKAPPT